jgi:hypothetical protein
MIKKISLFSVLTLIIVLASCTQIREALALTKCDFRLKEVTSLELGQINLLGIKSYSDINLMHVAKLGVTYASGKLPLDLKLNIEVRNPNSVKAALNRLDWIFMIDETQIVEGTTNYRLEVEPNGGVSTFPLDISADLKNVLSGQSLTSLVNMALNICDAGGKPTKLVFKAKPWITVGNTTIAYPGYINIKTEFGAQ